MVLSREVTREEVDLIRKGGFEALRKEDSFIPTVFLFLALY